MKEQKNYKKTIDKKYVIKFCYFYYNIHSVGLNNIWSIYIYISRWRVIRQKNKMGIMQEIKEKNNEENKIPNEALLDDTQNPKPPQKEDIEPEKQ
mgnify:FL=1